MRRRRRGGTRSEASPFEHGTSMRGFGDGPVVQMGLLDAPGDGVAKVRVGMAER